MKIAKRVISITICITLASSSLAWSNQFPEVGYAEGLVLPEAYLPFQENIESEIDKKNNFEFFNQQGLVTYNTDGTIGSVSYRDGTEVAYSYEYDEKGELETCILETNSTQIKFVQKSSEAEPEKKEILVEVYMKGLGESLKPTKSGSEGGYKSDSEEPSENKVVVKYPDAKWGLEDIARTPIKFDFEELKGALAKISELKQEAYQEYIKNTQPYYEEVCKELKTKFNLLELEISLSEQFERLGEGDAIGIEERKLIDDAIEQIRSQVNEEEGANQVAEEFLTVEETYRAEFLEPNKKILEDKINKALEYIYDLIDKLLNSKLAVYLNLSKDKIDAIINLPEKEKE